MKDKRKYKNTYGIPENALRRWTKASIDCYKIGCNCAFCDIPSLIESPCRMKQTVINLVRVFGIPEETEEKDEE